MLVTSKELLAEAKRKGCAIPAPNFVGLDMARWLVEAAEKKGLPLVLSFAETHIDSMIPLEDAAAMGRWYAEQASVPVVLHFDHGFTIPTIKKAIDCGFSSVMIDASSESFEENVRRTKEVIEYAHAHGVSVEAEIGHVGSGENYENHELTESQLTTVEEAKAFVAATGVDSLAVSIGTAHGAYKGVPEINFERLAQLAAAVDVPLVLHGGSSSGDDNLKKCSLGGIAKINIHTDLIVAAANEIHAAAPNNYMDTQDCAKKGIQACLEHYFDVFETK
ncbi:MAG: class II fructose-bisphosphate aldolase [Oscillospiraceae bacterium]|nr:class II fructose-bisphosphate aldolase [Oscillospiraceae bacterium]